MVKTTKNLSEATVITHGGVFHSDEVFATVLLSKLFTDLKVLRTFKVPENLAPDTIVYDIGGGTYDHHQKGGNGERENGIRYSSFGLLWRDFGRKVLGDIVGVEDVWQMIDSTLVQAIDATDNGQGTRGENPNFTISLAVSQFNPTWDSENQDSDQAFEKAVAFAEQVFDNTVASAIATAKAKAGVEEAIANSEGGVMVLSEFMPWQEHVFASKNPKASDLLYVVFPSNRGGYNVNAVPVGVGSFSNRKSLPEAWAGLKDAELQEVSGVPTAIFCHPARFICSAETFEDAMKMARKAVEE